MEISRRFPPILSGRSFFNIDSSGVLTLEGNITLNGYEDSDCNAALIIVDGTLNMEEGVTLKSNTNKSNGGAVNVNEGVFIMNGGTIRANTAKNGGGVYVGPFGSFIMNGGNICHNTMASIKESSGGGVTVAGSFDMFGGEIYNNSAVSGGGYQLDFHVPAGDRPF